jgi:hypothetical protein
MEMLRDNKESDTGNIKLLALLGPRYPCSITNDVDATYLLQVTRRDNEVQGAQSFLRSKQLLSLSRNFTSFM